MEFFKTNDNEELQTQLAAKANYPQYHQTMGVAARKKGQDER